MILVASCFVCMSCGSGRSLLEFWRSDKLLYILLEVCPACKDKVEIKCMGPVGGKTPTEPKIHSCLKPWAH
jgi:hypothetical protein